LIFSIKSFKLKLECSINCHECESSPTNCKSCSHPTPLLYNFRCYSTCPAGTYQFGSTCKGFSVNLFPKYILAYEENNTNCSYPTPFLYGSQCYSSCPNGTYQSSSNTCDCKIFICAEINVISL